MSKIVYWFPFIWKVTNKELQKLINTKLFMNQYGVVKFVSTSKNEWILDKDNSEIKIGSISVRRKSNLIILIKDNHVATVDFIKLYKYTVLGIFDEYQYENFKVDNLPDSTINGQSIRNVIKYRYEGIQNYTRTESKLLFMLTEYFKVTKLSKFKKIAGTTKCIRKDFNQTYLSYRQNLRNELIPQATFFNGKSFYLIDFYLPSVKLGIELDGNHHITDKNVNDYDYERDYFLHEVFGIDQIRIANYKLQGLKNKVIEFIYREISIRLKCLLLGITKEKLLGITLDKFVQTDYSKISDETISIQGLLAQKRQGSTTRKLSECYELNRIIIW